MIHRLITGILTLFFTLAVSGGGWDGDKIDTESKTTVKKREVKDNEKDKLFKECYEILKKVQKEKWSLKRLIKEQQLEIERFIKNLKPRLIFDDGIYYVIIKDKIYIYDLDDNLELKKSAAIIDKKTAFKFEPQVVHPRPFDYLSNIFKLGGIVLLDDNNNIKHDISLLYEFFSFDKLLNLYGFSLNASIGLSHLGGSLGYQFYDSTYFKNTSLLLGYSYNYQDKVGSPYFGISLNF